MTTATSNRLPLGQGQVFARDPLGALQQEFDDMLRRFRTDWNRNGADTELVPLIDLSEMDDAVQVRMDMPGMNASEIEVEVSGDTLRVRGQHKEEKVENDRTYHRVERRSGAFSRAIMLPVAVKADKVTAECKEGVLTITLPKCDVVKPRKVKVATK